MHLSCHHSLPCFPIKLPPINKIINQKGRFNLCRRALGLDIWRGFAVPGFGSRLPGEAERSQKRRRVGSRETNPQQQGAARPPCCTLGRCLAPHLNTSPKLGSIFL